MPPPPSRFAARDAKGPDVGHFRRRGPRLFVHGPEAGVFDNAFEVVDIVVPGLYFDDGLFVMLFEHGQGLADLPLHLDEQESEARFDLMHRAGPGA